MLQHDNDTTSCANICTERLNVCKGANLRYGKGSRQSIVAASIVESPVNAIAVDAPAAGGGLRGRKREEVTGSGSSRLIVDLLFLLESLAATSASDIVASLSVVVVVAPVASSLPSTEGLFCSGTGGYPLAKS